MLALFICATALACQYEYQVPPRGPHEPPPMDWLLLPMVDLLISPVYYGIIAGGIMVALSGKDDVYEWVGGLVFLLPFLVKLGYTLYAATCFFRKKTHTPRVMITLYAMRLALLIPLSLIVAVSAGSEAFWMLTLSAINALIWIPYFRRSKCVKATFVR